MHENVLLAKTEIPVIDHCELAVVALCTESWAKEIGCNVEDGAGTRIERICRRLALRPNAERSRGYVQILRRQRNGQWISGNLAAMCRKTVSIQADAVMDNVIARPQKPVAGNANLRFNQECPGALRKRYGKSGIPGTAANAIKVVIKNSAAGAEGDPIMVGAERKLTATTSSPTSVSCGEAAAGKGGGYRRTAQSDGIKSDSAAAIPDCRIDHRNGRDRKLAAALFGGSILRLVFRANRIVRVPAWLEIGSGSKDVYGRFDLRVFLRLERHTGKVAKMKYPIVEHERI